MGKKGAYRKETNGLPNAIWRKLDRSGPHWLWTGRVVQKGYGRCTIRGRRILAHVAVYEAYIGPVPDGFELDHLCRIRSCANPFHVQPVPKAENPHRGLTGLLNNWNRAKTECPQGHAYAPENTYLRPVLNKRSGRMTVRRRCRICTLAQNAARRG